MLIAIWYSFIQQTCQTMYTPENWTWQGKEQPWISDKSPIKKRWRHFPAIAMDFRFFPPGWWILPVSPACLHLRLVLESRKVRRFSPEVFVAKLVSGPMGRVPPPCGRWTDGYIIHGGHFPWSFLGELGIGSWGSHHISHQIGRC